MNCLCDDFNVGLPWASLNYFSAVSIASILSGSTKGQKRYWLTSEKQGFEIYQESKSPNLSALRRRDYLFSII